MTKKMTWPEMQESLKKMQKTMEGVKVIQVEKKIEPPESEYLYPPEFFDGLSHIMEFDDMRDKFKGTIYENYTDEEMVAVYKKGVIKESCNTMGMFQQVMHNIHMHSKKEGYIFRSPVEHVKYCAIQTMKVLREVEKEMKEDGRIPPE